MSDNKMLEDIVREVLKSMAGAPQAAAPATTCQSSKSAGLCPERDYPLASKRPELLKTPSGKTLADITLDKIMNGEVKSEDVRITPDTLKMQAEIADGVGRYQFANNLRRAAELVAIPDDRVLEIYNAMRPYRSTKPELFAIADELESKYNAKINAAFVREAAEVYERRNRLRAD
ncbi:diol dehydratase small subunit [Sporomusa acidovorans]|uniref:Propanediol dehydratase small subunit n=1 Tax=Sporomusa acidovorans (strain ATCC 49682 / DSM 3132 / Mol) TaxID=1123286 RepID=A0ABZ3IYX1_SPOA4|nr:diol dehydratase small subunit [Sporomusa acidovorans]OZC14145.1 propanediol dehydratase small subunit [Sporomusa acidovorans DSM 3132]SDE69516.1 propanediol dehydratase small subunit [Sporomusa acidovorans]